MEKVIGHTLTGVIAGIVTYLFGAWDVAFQVLCVFMVIDYITGTMCGYATKELSSQIGFKGVLKKVAMLISIIVAVEVDRVLETDVLRIAVIFCLIGNEGISLLENLTKLGVPIPERLVNALKQIKGKGDEDDTSSQH